MALRWMLTAVLLVVPLACETSQDRDDSHGNNGSAARPAADEEPSPSDGNGNDGPSSPAEPAPLPPVPAEPDPMPAPRVLDASELDDLSGRPDRFTFFPGDVIVINIFEEPELRNIEIRISTEMKLTFPYVGEIDLRGKGILDLEAELTRKLEKKLLTDAQVSVFLKTPAKRWIYTLGRLAYPHAFEIPPMGALCVADAISLSRGFAEDADRSKVEITRTMEGRIVEFFLPRRYFKTFYLVPGDKIRVLEARRVYVRGEVRDPGAFLVPEFGLVVEEALTRAKVKEEADLSRVVVQRRGDDGRLRIHQGVAMGFPLQPGDMVLATGLRKVYVIGSVQKPGGFTIPTGGLRATMAVALAEGWTRLAAPNDTYVKRKMADGTTRVFEVPLKDIMQGKVPEKNIQLEPGDEVYVPESFF